MLYTLENESLTVRISDHGAELRSVVDRVSGREYLWQGNPAIWDEHSPLLFPFCGRLKNAEYTYHGKTYPMGVHGFLKETDLPAPTVSGNTMTFTLTETEETLAHYPFRFTLTLVYRLEGRTLSFFATVKNTGDETLPFAFGGHPGIAIRMKNDDIAAGTAIRFDGDVSNAEVYPLINGPFASPVGRSFPMKNGTLPLDNALLDEYNTLILKNVPETVTLTQTDGLKVGLTRSETLPYFCLWKSTKKGADYICLEPWSGTPSDGLSDEVLEDRPGLCRVKVGESENFSYTLTFSDKGDEH